MYTLSKSKLMACQQCQKRLWLEVHRPEDREDSAATQTRYRVGHSVGEMARRLYDPEGQGVLLDPQKVGFEVAHTRTQKLLETDQPIFEACFRVPGALAIADVLLPVPRRRKRSWRMVEVKSSTSVKDEHRADLAIQAFVARATGAPLTQASLAHVDSQWVYPGDEDYRGLLIEEDLTDEVFGCSDQVRDWIKEAHRIVALKREPPIATGPQCHTPYPCGFLDYCKSQEPQTQHPVEWLPGKLNRELAAYIAEHGVTDLSDLPDGLLNRMQKRVQSASLSGQVYFDREAARSMLRRHKPPLYFLDFETIQFAVPIWKGTRPYQNIPFQFSLHRLFRGGRLEHKSFLDLSGSDPSRSLAQALLAACGEKGTIFAYNKSFEATRIRELAKRFPHLSEPLQALNERMEDLLPVAKNHYYHPGQQGSWSLKEVLPTLCPDLAYDDLEGVQDGTMAMDAFMEAIAPQTRSGRKTELEGQLHEYCKRDTLALVRLWSAFSGTPVDD